VATISWRKAALVAAVVPMLALSACSSGGGRTPETGTGGGGGQVATTERMKIALIAHAPLVTLSGIPSVRAQKKLQQRTMSNCSTRQILRPAGRRS
jgi:hypothetical protein